VTFGHVFFEIRVQTDRHRVYKYTDIDTLIATVCSSQLFREQSNCRNNILDITDVEIFNSVLIFYPSDSTLTRVLAMALCLPVYLYVGPVVNVDRRIRWHYTTTILRLRIGARLTMYRNCKFHNFARTISRHADGISRKSVPPSAGPFLPRDAMHPRY